MPIPRVRGVFALLVLGGSLWIGARPLGPLPPLGPFLDPVHGVWAVARRADLPRSARAAIPGLTAAVDVRYDDRGVPHIFASTTDDAYRALGYVVARDRLFQMELQTRATAGTLSELLGPVVLESDREQRRLGLARSADRAAASLPSDSPAARAIRAYADGVNAWIDGLRPADLPLEYRLLNARPMRWKPEHSIYLLRRMGWTLTYQSEELRRERLAALVGDAAAAALLPANSPIQEPIVPGAGSYPWFDRTPLPPPMSLTGRTAGGREGGTVRTDGIGSNNWAVAPERSASGNPLLAGDPHLDLTLPSIWYEVHLRVEGDSGAEMPADPEHPAVRPSDRPPALDVYGVTIPGAPAVVIGFNRQVAWSFTNTEADVLDYFTEAVDDTARPTRYRLDGEWKPLEEAIEEFRDPRRRILAVDTNWFSHRGPLLRRDGRFRSARWTVLEAGSELAALQGMMAAASVDDWMDRALAWESPPQNMLVADNRGNIAIRSTGRFPVRPGDGGGLVVRDGRTGRNDWRGVLLPAQQPAAFNPRQGYLASANQQPIDPRNNPAYLGSGWAAPWRAMRINQLLRSDSAVTIDEMRQWQTDGGSARADFFVPYFLRAGGDSRDSRDSGDSGDSGDSALVRAATLLGEWDRRYNPDNKRAVLFELTMSRLANLVWDELVDSTGRPVARPSDAVLARLLHDAASAWWDVRSTPDVREDRDAVLRRALVLGLDDALRQHGGPDGDGWRWETMRTADIFHLLRIPAFSAVGLPVQGGPGTLNPTAGSNGASWRMVVELGQQVRGWGIYPGGQSGNPVSPRYEDRLDDWVAGQLDTLRFPWGPEQVSGDSLLAELKLEPPR